MWRGIGGFGFTAAEFERFCAALPPLTMAGWWHWRPQFVVLHNTAQPSLADRPDGLTRKHLANLEHFFRDVQHWSAGPHLFIDDHQIWTFSPLAAPGVHSPSWNNVAIGVEMLGDYEREAFDSGRGAAVRDLTVAALASLHRHLHLDPAHLRLHWEDPATTHACPGKNVVKADVVARVLEAMA